MRTRILVLFVFLAEVVPLFAQGGAPVRLTLQQAAATALRNHPQVQAAQDVTSAADQKIREARAAYYPTVNLDFTGSQGNPQGRIGAGYLSASRLFNRYGQGVAVDQLITDSGRTSNLVAEARFRANATTQDYQTTRYQVLLEVNQAYFDTLRAQAMVKVAQETLAARQLLVDQVTALAANKLRSQVDVSFAEVNRAQAQLLLIRSQNELKGAYAELTRTLGSEQPASYELQDQELPPSPPADVELLVAQAMHDRPELESLRQNQQAANAFERAERDLSYPTASLVGVGGYMPYINQITLPRRIPSEYEGVAVNLTIPVLNGHLFAARREEAHYRELEAEQRIRDMQQRIARDVRMAWGNAVTAYQGLDVTAQLLRAASLAMSLAQGRYDNGLADIVVLTQAQLNLTDAEIQNLNAKYDYQTQYADLQYSIGSLR